MMNRRIVELASSPDTPKFVFGSDELEAWTRKHVDPISGRCFERSGWYVVAHSGFCVLSAWSYGQSVPLSYDVPKGKSCCQCGESNALDATLCVTCCSSTFAFAMEEEVSDVLDANGWDCSHDKVHLGRKAFATAVGIKEATVYLTPGDNYNRTLVGTYESEGRNILEPHSVLIPRIATLGEVQALARTFVKSVDVVVANSYAARLL